MSANNTFLTSNQCYRCVITSKLITNPCINFCETCKRSFCKKCYIIHDKHDECFCEHKNECYICKEPGFYDYSIMKPVCWGHF